MSDASAKMRFAARRANGTHDFRGALLVAAVVDDHRMPERGQVDADLVRAPGV